MTCGKFKKKMRKYGFEDISPGNTRSKLLLEGQIKFIYQKKRLPVPGMDRLV